MRHSCVLHVWHAWVMCVPWCTIFSLHVWDEPFMCLHVWHMHELCLCLDAYSWIRLVRRVNIWMVHVIHVNAWVGTHVDRSRHTRNTWVISHICIIHVTHVRYDSCVYMCDVSFDTCESCRTSIIHVTHVNTAVTGCSQRRGIFVAVCCSVLRW